MLAILVICFLALTVTALTLYIRRRTPAVNPHNELEPPGFAGLFSAQEPTAAASETNKVEDLALRANLIDRARSGDRSVLVETSATENPALYNLVLDALTESASDNSEKLQALVFFVSTNGQLRGNKRLAERVMARWEAAADKRSTIEMIHIAALSDDAAIYQGAVELIVSFWKKGKLSEFTPEALIELFDSQFWVLAPEARQGGAAFALKRKLAGVRRELATTTPARS
jgi:hypothetical protein